MILRKYISLIVLAFCALIQAADARPNEPPAKIVILKVTAEKFTTQPASPIPTAKFHRTDALVFYEDRTANPKANLEVSEKFSYQKSADSQYFRRKIYIRHDRYFIFL